ncbi:B-cell receptor-associated protein 31 [Eurytemora carolleeae]|uniref:B-cell receptor-associated protein 31 n=1 Tax=Eurytemora carolleeae TaxID=1294199 RepID=UPI000C7943E6|nr:B-cell receptor-associated protein 31 [Eurytemora carolleeae]|eukprot:XP_023335093.1 B-cell receptor-associated protein 31-like [Eurytemora affinis]
MSLHWTLIAGFLYAEIAFIALLLLPFISNKTWHKMFKSRFLRGLESQLIYYFYVLVSILIMFFLDALREMQKYSSDETKDGQTNSHLDAQMQTHMRLFRAQRNFYISGFALFLCVVIKTMVGLISANATLQAEKEAAMKQAESASRAAESLMKGGGEASEDSAEGKKLKEHIAKLEKELSAANKNVESMKTQSKNLTVEYDRLMEEKDKLERKVNIMGEKKDD